MYLVYVAVRFFPYWALPLIFIMADLTVYFRRKGSPLQLACGGSGVLLLVMTVLWFVFRGDLNSDVWVRSVVG